MMQRVKKAGGLRKELTAEKCVRMLLEYHTDMNILQCCVIANDIKNKVHTGEKKQ